MLALRWLNPPTSAFILGARLQALLLAPTWLRAKLTATNPQALIQDFNYLSPHPDLDAIQGALRLSLHILAEAPEQLAE